MGEPFLAKQPRWAAASIPSARPLRTGQPASASARPNSSAIARPWSEAEQVPTTAMVVRALICRSSDRSPSTYNPEGGEFTPSRLHGQAGSPGNSAQAGTSSFEQPRARACNSLSRANSAPAKPAPGQGVRSTNPRAGQGRWLDHDKTCADRPCVRCPSQVNRSRATTTPSPAPSKYMCTSSASATQGLIHCAWRTSWSITSCSCAGTRRSTRPSRTITKFTDASATTVFLQTKRETHGQRTPC